MTIRKAEHSDIPDLAAVAERSYRTGFGAILGEEIVATRTAHFFAQRFEPAWERMLVALSEGRVAGFCMITDAHIDMLFVDPEATGQGLGSALLRQAESAGASTLECFRDNLRARQFYEKHGWRVVKEYERDFIGQKRGFVLYVSAHQR